jgi:PTS system N-acetylglucosamine-specific IIC component
LASKPVLLIFVGLGFGVVYYLIFVFAIKKFDLSTPGRVDESGEGVAELIEEKGLSGLAAEYLNAIGGKGNVVEVDACITRLRLTLKDSSIVSEDMVKTLGASGVIRPNNKNVQIVVGTKAEIIADEMKRLL